MGTKQECIVFDVDQVLLDYISRLRDWFNRTRERDISGFPNEWNLTEWLDLESDSDMLSVLNEFANSWEFGTLNPMSEAKDTLGKFVKEGFSLICVTACGDYEQSRNLRRANLYHHFGDIFDEIYFVGFGDSKSTTLNDIKQDYDIVAFIDDKPANLLDAYFISEIDNIILMKSPHNKRFREDNPQILTAYSVYDCYQHVQDFCNE